MLLIYDSQKVMENTKVLGVLGKCASGQTSVTHQHQYHFLFLVIISVQGLHLKHLLLLDLHCFLVEFSNCLLFAHFVRVTKEHLSGRNLITVIVDSEYRCIAQACDRRTSVGLARYPNTDPRFFRKFPKLSQSEVSVLLFKMKNVDIFKLPAGPEGFFKHKEHMIYRIALQIK